MRTQVHPTPFHYVFFPLAGFLLLATLAGCSSKGEDTANRPPVHADSIPVAQVIAIGRIEPEKKITALGTEVSGIVEKIYAHAGDTVSRNAPVVTLSSAPEKARLELSKAKVATQAQEIQVTQASLASARLKADNLKEKLARTQQIFNQGAETRQNLDDTQLDYQTALKEVNRLEASLQSSRRKLKELEADVHVSAVEVERRTVRAPEDGIVLTMDLTEGALISGNATVADFAPSSPLTALCEVDELFANRVKVGQRAMVRTQGTTDTLGVGEVMYVAPSLKKKSLFSDDTANLEDRRVREVRIRLRAGTQLLYNSRVECVIGLR